MQEDLQKNFILLSKVAKEKKYAQEYMGLLARRGDIGSIRIGKRWYTTWQWFEEFLENSQKKKMESVCEIATEPAQNPAKQDIESGREIKINVPLVFPEREKVYAAQPVMRMQREEKIAEQPASSADKPAKIAVAVKTKSFEMPVRKNISGDIRITNKFNPPASLRKASFAREAFRAGNVFVEKKNENPLPYKEIKFRKNKDVFSPVFGMSEVSERMRSIFFPKLVFAAGFAIIFLLVAVSGYFVFSDGIFKKGMVAGASSERKGVFSGISSEGEYFLSNAGDKIKESLSVSRVAVEAAKERGNTEN
jgi:hypothetical protein